MDAVELTRELIKIESTDPGSWETEIGEYICDYLKESGADTEAYEVEPGRKIVKGVVKGAKAHPALVFICHMDTVVMDKKCIRRRSFKWENLGTRSL